MGALRTTKTIDNYMPTPAGTDGLLALITSETGEVTLTFTGYYAREESRGYIVGVAWGPCWKYSAVSGIKETIDPPEDVWPIDGEDQLYDEDVEDALDLRLTDALLTPTTAEPSTP